MLFLNVRENQRSHLFSVHFLWELILLLLIFTGVLCGPDSRGNEFIISFMENQSNEGGNLKFVDLYISTASVNEVTVNVSAPKYYVKKLYQTFKVTFGNVKHLKLDYGFQNFGSNRSSKGIHITATDEIIVFSINKQSSTTDGFLAFPVDVLGLTHYAVCFSYDSNTEYKSDVVVVGTEDNTTLSIQLSENRRVQINFEGKTYRCNEWINLTLNMFDTLQLETLGDLTGSLIQANKPITVLTGNMKTNLNVDGSGGGRDHLVEQIPPTVTWGKHFVTVPFPGRSDGYVLRFLASEDHTEISVSGCIRKTFNLRERSFKQENIRNSNCFLIVNSTKPILIAQFSKSTFGKILSDPAMHIVPPIEQYASDYVISSPPATHGNFHNYFLIVIKESEKDGLMLDGKNIRGTNVNLKHISGTDFVGGYVYVGHDTASHTIKHQSPISVFGAVAYGGALYESYSFPVGVRLAAINQACKSSLMVVADGIDNDCDDYIDEEICNGKDEDGDLQIDEDCAAADPVYTLGRSITTKQTFTTASSTVTIAPTSTAAPSSTTRPSSTTTPSSTIHYPMISLSTTEPSPTKAGTFSKGKQLRGDYTNRKSILVLPHWLKTLEAVILVSISCLVLGMSMCLCQRLISLASRRNEKDEEERLTLWKKKKRPLPLQRKH